MPGAWGKPGKHDWAVFFTDLDCGFDDSLFLISKTPSGYILGIATAVLVVAASWLFVNYTPVGQDDNHVLSIGIGGGHGFHHAV